MNKITGGLICLLLFTVAVAVPMLLQEDGLTHDERDCLGVCNSNSEIFIKTTRGSMVVNPVCYCKTNEGEIRTYVI